MGRPKEFNEDHALDRAVEVFRQNGYKGTSVEDLLSAMGISRSSFYDAFGDKHHLFLRAFDRYVKHRRDRLCAILQEPGPRKPLIRRHLEDVIDDSLTPPYTGCLLVTSAIEFAAQNPAIADRLQSSFALMEDLLFGALEAAKETGELPPKADARAVAKFLVSTVRGLRVTSRVNPDRATLCQIADVALSILAEKA